MTEVELRLSANLFGGNPRGLIAHLGLNGRHLGGERWAVRPNEDQHLISSYDLADETGLAHRFDHLNHVPDSPTIALDEALVERFEQQRAQLAKLVLAGDMSAFFHQIQLNVVTAARADLVDVVRDAYDGIGLYRLSRGVVAWS